MLRDTLRGYITLFNSWGAAILQLEHDGNPATHMLGSHCVQHRWRFGFRYCMVATERRHNTLLCFSLGFNKRGTAGCPEVSQSVSQSISQSVCLSLWLPVDPPLVLRGGASSVLGQDSRTVKLHPLRLQLLDSGL